VKLSRRREARKRLRAVDGRFFVLPPATSN